MPLPPGYAVRPLPVVPAGETVSTDMPEVPDVEHAYRSLFTIGDHLAVRDADLIPGSRYTSVNVGGVNRAICHLQGIQRLSGRNGKYLVVSGGDPLQPASHLFVAELGSGRVRRPLGSNVLLSRDAPDGDRLVKTIAIDREYWHGGGMAVLGDVVAVPLESDTRAKVVFLDLADPLHPRRLRCEIQCTNGAGHVDGVKGGAVGLTRLPGGHYLCLLYREVGSAPKGRFDWYLSRTPDLSDGFHERPSRWTYVPLADGRDPQYQMVTLFVDGTSEGATRLLVIATENDDILTPVVLGQNLCDLWSVEIGPEYQGPAEPPAAFPALERVESLRFRPFEEHANFRAACGVHVDHGGRLNLYGAFHWRLDGQFRLTEFRQRVHLAADPIHDIQDGWIELYEHPHFAGRRMSVLSRRNATLRDYRQVRAQGGDFNDKVSSARAQLPPGERYRLYADPGYRGRSLDLVGTGRVVELPRLRGSHPEMNDRITSSRFV